MIRTKKIHQSKIFGFLVLLSILISKPTIQAQEKTDFQYREFSQVPVTVDEIDYVIENLNFYLSRQDYFGLKTHSNQGINEKIALDTAIFLAMVYDVYANRKSFSEFVKSFGTVAHRTFLPFPDDHLKDAMYYRLKRTLIDRPQAFKERPIRLARLSVEHPETLFIDELRKLVLTINDVELSGTGALGGFRENFALWHHQSPINFLDFNQKLELLKTVHYPKVTGASELIIPATLNTVLNIDPLYTFIADFSFIEEYLSSLIHLVDEYGVHVEVQIDMNQRIPLPSFMDTHFYQRPFDRLGEFLFDENYKKVFNLDNILINGNSLQSYSERWPDRIKFDHLKSIIPPEKSASIYRRFQNSQFRLMAVLFICENDEALQSVLKKNIGQIFDRWAASYRGSDSFPREEFLKYIEFLKVEWESYLFQRKDMAGITEYGRYKYAYDSFQGEYTRLRQGMKILQEVISMDRGGITGNFWQFVTDSKKIVEWVGKGNRSIRSMGINLERSLSRETIKNKLVRLNEWAKKIDYNRTFVYGMGFFVFGLTGYEVYTTLHESYKIDSYGLSTPLPGVDPTGDIRLSIHIPYFSSRDEIDNYVVELSLLEKSKFQALYNYFKFAESMGEK